MKQELNTEHRRQDERSETYAGDEISWLACLHANAAQRWLKTDPPKWTEAVLSLRLALEALEPPSQNHQPHSR